VRISFRNPTFFDRFMDAFKGPAAGDRVSQRYRCDSCQLIFVAPDRRLLAREDDRVKSDPDEK
jgi:hypothetical protein